MMPFVVMNGSGDKGDTIISVNPSSEHVLAGNNFNVTVSCVPSQPIKAFEFSMSFNPSLFKANSVIEGNLFDGYTTFFNEGTINNYYGTIVKVYGLIVGSGNVTNSGTLVSISFTAKENSDTSSFDINGVGVTDETGYIPISVSNGVITSPEIPIDEDSEQNNPPNKPLKPFGPIYIEVGIEYTYSSSTTDIDGNQIRYKFDWGNGHISNWSRFVPSNASVSMNYSWNSTSNYLIRVIAQDENGSNSSWSPSLNVTVLQFDFTGIPPVADFEVPTNITTNQTIVFNASNSYDEDGIIISYFWDFGDGENAIGINPTHVYKNPGEYNATLFVTDNNGNTHNKSKVITVTSEIAEERVGKHSVIVPFDFGPLLIVIILLMFIILSIIFRESVKSFVSYLINNIHIFSHWKLWNIRNRINRINAKIEKIENINLPEIDIQQTPIVEAIKPTYESQVQYNRDRIYMDISNSYKKKSSDVVDKENKIDKIDEIIDMDFNPHKNPSEIRDNESFKDVDFKPTINKEQFSERKNNQKMLDIEKENIVEVSNIKDIERIVDGILKTKEKDNIDYL